MGRCRLSRHPYDGHSCPLALSEQSKQTQVSTQPTCTLHGSPSPLLPAQSLSAARLPCAPWQLHHSVASRLPQQTRTLTPLQNSLALVLPPLVLQDLVLVLDQSSAP